MGDCAKRNSHFTHSVLVVFLQAGQRAKGNQPRRSDLCPQAVRERIPSGFRGFAEYLWANEFSSSRWNDYHRGHASVLSVIIFRGCIDGIEDYNRFSSNLGCYISHCDSYTLRFLLTNQSSIRICNVI